MKLITRNTDYALRALCFIAQNKKITTVSELVKKLNIPYPFLRRILQQLSRKKFLKSYKGKKGGFILDKSINNLSLLDLINIFQGRFKLNECLLKNKTCPKIRNCVLRKKIKKLENYITSELSKIKIVNLFNLN